VTPVRVILVEDNDIFRETLELLFGLRDEIEVIGSVSMGDSAPALVAELKPDVVLISLIGTDSIVFNRAFAECGLAASTLRLAGAMDETVLLGIGADNSENLFCASGYFSCVGSRANDDFLNRYRAMFGANAPPVGSVGQSNYEGLCFLEAAAAHAGSLSLWPLLPAARNIVYMGARGPVTMRNGRAEMPMYLAEADGLDFKLIKTL